jgi:hypothetical protein
MRLLLSMRNRKHQRLARAFALVVVCSVEIHRFLFQRPSFGHGVEHRDACFLFGWKWSSAGRLIAAESGGAVPWRVTTDRPNFP